MLHITPDMLEQGYELLKLSKPFSAWKLPDADKVVFLATSIDAAGKHGSQGQHWHDGVYHHIQVNPERHHTYHAMLMTLAHEMVHVRQYELGRRNTHGVFFERLSAQVCRHHCFDLGQF